MSLNKIMQFHGSNWVYLFLSFQQAIYKACESIKVALNVCERFVFNTQ